MADVFDVQNAVAAAINTAIQPLVGATYPIAGIDGSTFGATATVPSIIVMPGNVLLDDLMTRLEQGKAQIQVEVDESNPPAPQYLAWQDSADPITGPSAPTLTIATSNNGKTVTLGGTITAGDVVGVTVGSIGAGYAVVGTDTLASVATNLAAAANTAGLSAAPSGVTVTITPSPANQNVAWNVGTTYTTRLLEVMRRRKTFFATLYVTTPYLRSYVGKTLETVFPIGTRLAMPDGTYATMVGPMVSHDYDEQQRDTTLVRRCYWLFDFLTTQVVSATQVVATADSFQVTTSGISITGPTSSQL